MEPDIDYKLSNANENVHHVWDNSLDPVSTIETGDVVQFECRDVFDGQITKESTAEDMRDVKTDLIHPLTGPVYIEGAKTGDVLVIELLDLTHKGWGFTGFFPSDKGLGLLPEDFEDPGLHIWDLNGDIGHFVNDIEVPLDLFPGIIGTAPGESGEYDTVPPRDTGGNMDVKQMTEGSTVYLPVECDGALFSISDCHAAQGDGEICVTGVEAPMFVTARFDVRTDMDIEQPQVKSDHPFTPTGRDEPMYGTTGIAPDLLDATKKAVRHMIDYLKAEHGLTRDEAYILCSAAVDLKISQVVCEPNWTVTAYVADSLFK